VRSVAGNVIAVFHTVTSITNSANICKLKERQLLRPLVTILTLHHCFPQKPGDVNIVILCDVHQRHITIIVWKYWKRHVIL